MRLLDFSNYIIHTNDPGKDDFNKRISEQGEKIKENEKFRRDYAAINLHDRALIRITKREALAEGANKNLLSCFNVPEELKPFVNDYKINVFNIAWLSNKTIDMFQSDFKIVAKYFQTVRLKREYKGTNEEIRHVDALLKMLSALTGDNSFEEVYNDGNLKKGGVTMCDVVEKIKAEGKEEIIRNLIESNAGTLEQIAAWVKLPVKEVKKIAAKVPVQA